VLLTTSTRLAGAPTQGADSTPELNSSVALQRTGPRGVWEAVPLWEAVLLGVEVVVALWEGEAVPVAVWLAVPVCEGEDVPVCVAAVKRALLARNAPTDAT
jgi:hypothetical protein